MVSPARAAAERIELVAVATEQRPPRYQPKQLARRAWIYLGIAIAVLFVGPLLYAALLDDHYRITLAKLPIVLKSTGMAATSILAAHWFTVAAINLGAALAWLIAGDGAATPVDRFIHFTNRQLGHIDCAVFSFLTAQAFLDATPHTLALLLALPVYGTGVMDFATSRLLESSLLRRWAALAPEDDHLWMRRPLFYVITAISLIALPWQAPLLWSELKRLVLVVALATAIRLARWILLTRRAVRSQTGTDEELARRVVKSEGRDWLVLVCVFALLALPVLMLARGPLAFSRDEAARTVQPADCGWRDGPLRAEMRLFLVADSQFHHMNGERVGTHLDLVDFVVPVAVRPVALDLLSGATLAHFAERYHALDPGITRFAHLGDIGDLGCNDELGRFGEFALRRFGRDGDRVQRRLAALLPGNHDSTFLGNFSWHPDWESACLRGNANPVRKRESDSQIVRMSEPYLAPDAQPLVVDHPDLELMAVSKTALPWVSRLGTAGGRDVVGAFVDTSDYTTFVLGIAGAQGGVSDRQMQKIREGLERHPNALVILFLHHPLDELSNLARARVTGLALTLDKRLVAIVSAHTHLAALRRHTVGKRVIPELVVGSTTDAPQEAALLEMGRNAGGRMVFQFRTLPAVARAGMTCDDPTENAALVVTAAQCRAVVNRIRAECTDLYEHWTENPGLVADRPATVKRAQQAQAARLLSCLCRAPERGCSAPPVDDALDDGRIFGALLEPLTDRFFGKRDELAKVLREELVCLSWAAGVLQAKKRNPDWQGPIALERAFAVDPSAAFGSRGVGILVEE